MRDSAQLSQAIGARTERAEACNSGEPKFTCIRAAKRAWRWTLGWKAFGLALVIALAAAPFAAAADLKGRAINETTMKPAAGDEVVLLSLSDEGMSEAARTRTDARGRFTLPVADPIVTHVVRVVHQGVTYHHVVEPGSRPVAVAVYEVADRVDGVKAVMDVERFEATNETLEVKQLITMRNDSRPPRTLMNDHPFEIQLPPDADVRSGIVQVEEAQPLKQKPIAGDRKGQYSFLFPLRPGDTRFAIVYRLPYNGQALIEPQLRSPSEKFVVMLPKSMKFDPRSSGVFHPMSNTTPDNVQGTEPVAQGQTLAFQISGTGMLEELRGRRQEAQGTKTTPTTGPGGGLGPPIEAPDPLQKYRWPILAGLAVLTVSGAVYATRKPRVSREASDPVFVRRVQRETAKQKSRTRRRRDRERAHV